MHFHEFITVKINETITAMMLVVINSQIGLIIITFLCLYHDILCTIHFARVIYYTKTYVFHIKSIIKI